MADPTLRFTFDDLRIRVAEYLGVADYSGGKAGLPVDTSDLDLVGRLVNDGYARFITDYEKWNFLDVPMQLTFLSGTVSGDNARYYLPDDFYGILLQPFTYPSTGPRISIFPVEEARIRELNAGAAVTGPPSLVTMRPIKTDNTATAQRWEAIFWPTPNAVYTVTAMYKRFPQKLTNGTDTSVAGFQHDQAILKAAIAAAELQVGDQAGPREAAYQTQLKMSIKIDNRAGPVKSQDYGDQSENRTLQGRRPLNYYGVATYNGVTLNP